MVNSSPGPARPRSRLTRSSCRALAPIRNVLPVAPCLHLLGPARLKQSPPASIQHLAHSHDLASPKSTPPSVMGQRDRDQSGVGHHVIVEGDLDALKAPLGPAPGAGSFRWIGAKPKPRWDAHLGGVGNGAGSLAAAFQPLIAGRFGSGA